MGNTNLMNPAVPRSLASATKIGAGRGSSSARAPRGRRPPLTFLVLLLVTGGGVPITVAASGEEASGTASRARDLWTTAREEAEVVRFSTLFTAQNVRDHLSTPEGIEKALRWCKDTAVTHVYLETFRDGYTAERATLSHARERFLQEGVLVSGCITTTRLGRRSVRGWSFPCFTDPSTLEKLARTFEFTAGLFDEIMIDDFFATGCECDACEKARGDRSWSEFRSNLLVDISRRQVLAPARKVNPKVKIIIKYPQWYDKFHERGYDVARQTAMFDKIWVGTETRDPDNRRWGRKSQYEAYYIMRWLGEIGGEKCGGGWFDPYGTSPPTYVEQARQTILAGAREVLLFCYGSLQRDTGPANVRALRAELPLLFRLAGVVRGQEVHGIAAPKPPGSGAHGDDYIYDFVGLLGLPLVPSTSVRPDVRAAFLSAHALAEEEIESKVERLLQRGVPLLVTRNFAERLPEQFRALPERVTVVERPDDPWQLMDLPAERLRAIRRSLLDPFGVELEAPTRVALYLFGEDIAVVESFNDRPVDVVLRKSGASRPAPILTIPHGEVPLSAQPGTATFRLPPRSLIALRLPGKGSQQAVRQALERAEKLVARLRPTADPRRLGSLAEELTRFDSRATRLAAADGGASDLWRTMELEARRLARAIAFSNPLLDFEKLLFIKRHDAGGPYHMCDQYYGCNARPGGGLFVLEDPFGPAPALRDVLENSVVENGRLRGKKLVDGSFLSPELSYDGKTILFAYSEARATETYQWATDFCYHIFRVNVDGSGLRQLTDGPWDDFDPCFLPGGRIAFISTRRGGYLRCGRHCPVYTLHSMAPDGSDIIRLSYHETHEWHPSVDHNGMIVYTRWDYVDRDTNIAHHIWKCFPDGRDPRSFHGNYPERRESRPWMEMSIRAIPGSRRYVATAAAHHGHAFGSLVMIDPVLEDDGSMSQLERLTPEVPFPEAEGGKGNIRRHMVYATPWPLSEDDYLCAYDPLAGNHGIYWIDRFGNRELIYRDPSIPCLSPIPLRPRRQPSVIPDQTIQTAAARNAARREGGAPKATIAVLNMYDSDFQWPAGAKVEALRIIHVLPKTTPPPNEPRIGVANQTNARAVLGTVPVEEDGSAYFEAPVGKPIYFQALDARGMAIQSMRSATYVHPGEQLVCQGCHERKRRLPAQPRKAPRALARPPSKILPDVEGTNPFNYVRLVQPVLDRNCVGCHREREAVDLSGALDGPNGWTRSYRNLAGQYGFYFHVSNGSISTGVHGGSRTTPGEFGARASKLLEYMDERHYGVTLSPEDFHRLTVWLDSNSEFYGAYENTEAQARGVLVRPSLD